MEKTKKKRLDPYRNIKYLGYRMSQLPKEYNLNELVKYAKFQLCLVSGKLMKDPIWDDYTIEELLVEFFAHQFDANKELRLKFEASISGLTGELDEFAAWADAQIAKEDKIREKAMGESKDKVVFNPNEVMGED